MTHAGIVALRLVATVAHCLPGVRVRLRHDDEVLLHVARPPCPAGPAIGPCQFRYFVARAVAEMRSGLQLGLMGLPHGVDPAIDVGTGPGDAVLPGGVYRVTNGEIDVHAFVTTVAPTRCAALLEGDGHVLPAAAGALHIHYDALTEVSVVFTADHPGRRGGGASRGLQDALVSLAAEEIVTELAAIGA